MNRHVLTALRSLAVAGGLGLASCAGPLGDFHPLYATAAGPGLSRIETRAPEGRVGYLLREQLDDDLAKDRGKPPLYRLNLDVRELRTPRGLRIDNVANRYELQLSARYALVDTQTRKILTSGSVVSIVTYDSADQAYAGIAAQLDGEKRVAADASQQLRLALATYFANPRGDATTTAPQALEAGSALDLSLTDRTSPQPVNAPGSKAETQPGREPVQ
jgi:LPS-assembly lipoprotein